MTLRLAGALLAASLCAATAAPAQFGFEDLYRIISLSSPQISPDGTRVLYVVRTADRTRDRWTRVLDVVDVASGAARTVATQAAGLSSPRWSPGGDRFAYLSAGAVWVAGADGDAPRRLTDPTHDVAQFAWRPDGDAIVFVAVDRAPAATGDARYLDAYEVGNDAALAAGAQRRARVWLQPLDASAARTLGPGSGSVTSGDAESTLSWSPDGGSLAYVHAPNNVANDATASRIRVVNVASGRERVLPGPIAGAHDPRFSPDGSRLAYASSAGDDQLNPVELFLTTPAGGRVRNVSHGVDRAIAKDGTLAFVGETPQRPDEVYVVTTPGAPRRLTNYNAGVAALTLAPATRLTYPTSVGVDGDAVPTKPPGFHNGAKYPLVVVIHGGPTSAALEDFEPLTQMLAARGWLVLKPNYRGSNNLGVRYQRAVGGDKLRGPGRDIEAALAAVRSLGIVDDARLAVSGWSYGAGLTLWMIAHRHDWRAAVAGAAVTDIAADYATADDIAADRALVGGSPFVPPYRARAAAMSPITYASQVRTPLLLITCRGDTRVSPVGTYEFYHALRDLGRPVTLIAYPVDGHFPSDPVRRTDVYRRWVGFIAERFAR